MKRLFNTLSIVSLLLGAAAAFKPAQAQATGWYGGGNSYYGGGYVSTGQWGMQQQPMMDMSFMYPAYVYNWNGAQPLGFSYMPPIGLSAIGNSMAFGAR